jgi:hypothetical protein
VRLRWRGGAAARSGVARPRQALLLGGSATMELDFLGASAEALLRSELVEDMDLGGEWSSAGEERLLAEQRHLGAASAFDFDGASLSGGGDDVLDGNLLFGGAFLGGLDAATQMQMLSPDWFSANVELGGAVPGLVTRGLLDPQSPQLKKEPKRRTGVTKRKSEEQLSPAGGAGAGGAGAGDAGAGGAGAGAGAAGKPSTPKSIKARKLSLESNSSSSSSLDSYMDEEDKPQGGSKQTSAFRGVSCCGKDRKWQARIRDANRVRYLGRYSTEVEAAFVYDHAARELKGDRAPTNFIRLDAAQREDLKAAFINNGCVVPESHMPFVVRPKASKASSPKAARAAAHAHALADGLHPLPPPPRYDVQYDQHGQLDEDMLPRHAPPASSAGIPSANATAGSISNNSSITSNNNNTAQAQAQAQAQSASNSTVAFPDSPVAKLKTTQQPPVLSLQKHPAIKTAGAIITARLFEAYAKPEPVAAT